MYAMERFVQETIFIIVLAIMGLVKSDTPFLCLLLAGMLLCLSCIKSLTDEKAAWLVALQFLLSCIFVMVADGYMSYLLFFLIGDGVVILPAVLYWVIGILQQQESLPMLIAHGLILTAVTLLVYIIRRLIEKYICARNQVAQAVSVTAVNEMYAKKLNQELIIKNYLADKNARLEERENISRNIHNSVGHTITAAIMTLDAADMLYDTAPDKSREKMNIARERIKTSLESIRQAVRVLDNENKFVSIHDFVSELTAVTDGFVMDTMIKVYADFENIREDVLIPHEHTEFLTGAMQELLSNGVRHGGADTFTVILTADSRNLKLKVSDNGKSDFSVENQRERIDKGFGLKKMLSYVKKCGGTMSFSNENGFKTEITIKLFKEETDG